jgi:hypothetical protein
MTKWRAYELIKGAPQGVRWFIGWFKILVVLCLGCLTWAQTDHVLKEGDRARDFSVTIDDSKHEQLAATIRGIRGAYAGVIESLGGSCPVPRRLFPQPDNLRSSLLSINR